MDETSTPDDTEKRASVYGLGLDKLLDDSVVVSPGAYVRLTAEQIKQSETGLARLQPTDIDDVKQWIGVPDELAARRACCPPQLPFLPGVDSAAEFRKLPPQDKLAVRQLANAYVNGDSRPLARHKELLAHVLDRAVIAGVFLRQDIDIHRGAVLEVDRSVKILFARHIRIYRGGLLKLKGDTKVDCVSIEGNLLPLSDTVSNRIPNFGHLIERSMA
jgi:hypothetical protein